MQPQVLRAPVEHMAEIRRSSARMLMQRACRASVLFGIILHPEPRKTTSKKHVKSGMAKGLNFCHPAPLASGPWPALTIIAANGRFEPKMSSAARCPKFDIRRRRSAAG